MLEIRPVTGGPDKLNKKCCGSDFWSEGFFFADRRRFVAKMWPRCGQRFWLCRL